MRLETFFEKFELFADAPDAVARMRELVLELAVQGQVVEQNSTETPALASLRGSSRAVRALTVNGDLPVPAGWAPVPLGCAIASNTGGGTPSKQNPAYWNGSIPWASVKDIQSDKFLTTTLDSITEEGLRNSSSNLIPPNRLLVVTRMGLGKLAINKIPVAINQDLRAIEPNEALDLDFAYLLFKALKLVGKGVTVKGVTLDELHSMPVALPPLAEQKRIVAKVDELMALCDRLEAQQQERDTRHAALARASLARFAKAPTPANLDFLFHKSYPITPADLRKTILTLAVQGKLVPQNPNDEPAQGLLAGIERQKTQMAKSGATKPFGRLRPISESDIPNELPESWVWVRAESICEAIVDCPHSTPIFVASGVICLDTNSFKQGQVIPHKIRYVSEETYEERVRRLVPKTGDIVFAREGSVGESVIVSEGTRCCLGQRVMLFRLMSELSPQFIRMALSEASSLDRLLALHKGIGAKHVNVADMRNALLPLPPLAEQRRIVAKVDQLMALVDQLETQLAVSRATAAKLMEAVVAELTAQQPEVAA